MQESVYEVIALGARYWFAFLGVMIVWRAFKWLRKDRRAKHRRLRQLPDAGMIGEMVVLQGSDELPEGLAIPVPREGTLGFLRTCDVVVPVDGVRKLHLDFAFQDGKGLLLFPLRGCPAAVDGTELIRRKSKKHPMHHGSRLQVGQAVLRLRLFEGLETGGRAVLMEDAPHSNDFQPFDDQPPQDWESTPYVYHQVPVSWQDAADPWQPLQPWQDEPWQEQPWQGEQPWQSDAPFHAQEEIWQEEAYPQEPIWQEEPLLQDVPMDDFSPAQARQRRSRLLRRRDDER